MRSEFVFLLLIFVTISFSAEAIAQQSKPSANDSLNHVVRDPRIDHLVQAHVKQNKNRVGVEGYRVQIYSGSGNEARKGANDIRKQIIMSNPDVAAHLVYQPPNFKVRVGDCRTEVEAIRLMRHLAYDFPQGFVVRDLIKLPRLAIEGGNSEMDVNNLDAPVEIQVRPEDEGQ